ncbi:MAG: DUF1761 domain-containing protein [Alphaproteobacteria bacterium]|nr:DUF1761 domain-containing protein [Alphaproteobacteria bacterium]
MPDWDVNYAAVLVATVAAMIIGFIWYMPALAGKTWMAAIGKTEAEIRAGAKPSIYIAAFVLALLQMTVLAAVLGWAGASGIQDGIVTEVLVWILVFAAIALNILFEGRATALYWVYGGNSLVTFVIAGAVIGWWRAM